MGKSCNKIENEMNINKSNALYMVFVLIKIFKKKNLTLALIKNFLWDSMVCVSPVVDCLSFLHETKTTKVL